MHSVYDYINQHLDEDFTLEQLAARVHFSKYHFHRQFTAYSGISVFRFIQLARLKRASYYLVFSQERSIVDIALEAKFKNPESFSRAFKSMFAQSPSQFRSLPDWSAWRARLAIQPFTIAREEKMDVCIVVREPVKVAIFEHRGSPERVLVSAQQFMDWRKQTGLSPVSTSATFGIAYDDPSTVKPEDFRFDIAGAIKGDIPANSFKVKAGMISGGRCAKVSHAGSHDHIEKKIHYLYANWLPQSGEIVRDSPCFFHYINLIPHVEEHELITDIYLPLV